MISNQNTSTDPQLSREEAIEILNTPDENLDELTPGLRPSTRAHSPCAR